ncbi:ABC transporter ATP-binding protein [Aureimonas altamirensis]|uniref:ABC transporter ATP-binding protein n=1 Tax=Aureimonas altamirensis TaxID=370622 RepID=UPI001E4FD5D4|nr:ABC transporter ATP-binding protein [Aureimonas altamirensis]UHD43795.1 ABC transporter ATP-binding protein [Aureimonas altamirensis]
MQPAFLDISAAAKSFGDTTVLDGVDLTIARGEFVSLLGPSGCGKTTLLRIVAGLLKPDSGSVRLDGADITSVPPHKRDVGVVFQNYALFPHLTVAENVAFGLSARRAPKAEALARVSRLLDLVGLGHMADRSVRGLSGGQQQRVAVARALAPEPKLLLLDEPFSALDRKLRETMQIELRRILRDVGTTSIFVTHDQDEALVMSDRIAVMNRGRIEHLGVPHDIYRRPATPFTLDFVGLSTRVAGTVRRTESNRASVDTAFGTVTAEATYLPGSSVMLGVRPERIALDARHPNRIRARLTDAIFQGARAQLHFEGTGGDRILVEALDVPPGLRPGHEIDLSFTVEDTLIYPAQAAGEPA